MIPKDDYIGDPGYPAPWATTLPREGLRDTDEARIVCLAPDVCKSPSAPIPYMIVDFCGHDQGYTPSVRFTSQKAMVLRSQTTDAHGDAPGVGKGVKSGTVGGICEPIGHASNVRSEGSPVIRHLDRFHMNNRNTVGEALFVRDTATFRAPVNDDPLPGSLLLADASGDWTGFLEPPPVEAPALETAPTTNLPAAPASESLQPPPPPEEPPPGFLRRIGSFARWLNPLAVITGNDPVSNAMGYEILSEAEVDKMLEGIVPRTLAEQQVYDSVRDRVRRHIRDNYGELFGGRDEDYIEQELDYLRREIARQREAEGTATDENVRVDEPVCPVVPIFFDSHGDRAEFTRQIEEQEARLNRMTPTEYLARRAPLTGAGRSDILAARRRASLPHQEGARREYELLHRADYIDLHGEDAWEDHIGSLAATHELDLIAGGYENEISGMGGAAENSSIGPQWRAGSRSGLLDDHARRLQQNGCPFVRVDLIVN